MEHEGKRMAKIGLIQVSADYTWSVEKCQEELLLLAENCCRKGADLVFMPEAYQYKNCKRLIPKPELVRRYAAPFKEKCAELARKYGTYIVPWDYELVEGREDQVYNISYILDRQGNEIGKYRKVLITLGEEEGGVAPGNDFPVFDLDIGKVGIMICFDNYFPEAARCLALRGAELILYPLYGDTLKDQWEIKMKARAIDYSVYVASCQIHPSPKEVEVTYTGMVGPTGELLSKLTGEGTWTVVDIEMGKQVITETSGAGTNKFEDIKQYLLRTRRHGLNAFQPVIEPTRMLEWDEIKVTK